MVDFQGAALLGPLTKGGNLPYRRLCVELGAKITMSEMAYARQVVRRSKSELALLRRHETEGCFGVQLAAGKPEDAVRAGAAAVERGAAFVDLNCGCPIHDVVRRGMGATLLQRPAALERIVAALVEALPVPVTAKIRIGWKEGEENALEIGQRVEQAGAAALAVHGRTREQRYTRAADWQAIAALVDALSIPVIGNGDVLTWYEARARREQSGCAAVMLARGALIKPWLFDEIARSRDLAPSAVERVGIYRRLAAFMVEHFRDDEKGRQRAMQFLPWHFSFFCRYRPLPEAEFEARSREHPLIQTRFDDADELPLLEQVLRDPRPELHERIAALLWERARDEDDTAAVDALEQLGREMPPVREAAAEVAPSNG